MCSQTQPCETKEAILDDAPSRLVGICHRPPAPASRGAERRKDWVNHVNDPDLAYRLYELAPPANHQYAPSKELSLRYFILFRTATVDYYIFAPDFALKRRLDI
jgi:hypothetical protein